MTCTCDRREQLCPEGLRLWSDATRAYQRARNTDNAETWAEYETALAAYRDHFGTTT